MRRREFSRLTWFGPSRFSTLAILDSGTCAGRRLDQQVGQRLRAARRFRQAHQQIEAAIAFDDLRDAFALDHLLQRAQQRCRAPRRSAPPVRNRHGS